MPGHGGPDRNLQAEDLASGPSSHSVCVMPVLGPSSPLEWQPLCQQQSNFLLTPILWNTPIGCPHWGWIHCSTCRTPEVKAMSFITFCVRRHVGCLEFQ
ncbi:hypothetical protein AAFF_G00023140 [Aldrovandia affinis]|uniref:Uncharacterized protein n=1 Tax=Aldrovandia affinis TaxID=143900 RepID=A0AAD7WYV5_9TELE|nr:hypothetical protein AAFF_G00023140 [Aldrovandia affinis]